MAAGPSCRARPRRQGDIQGVDSCGNAKGEQLPHPRSVAWLQVIRDSTLHTYRIEENPQYSDAMLVKTTLKIHAGASFLVRNPAQQGTIVQVMPTGS